MTAVCLCAGGTLMLTRRGLSAAPLVYRMCPLRGSESDAKGPRDVAYDQTAIPVQLRIPHVQNPDQQYLLLGVTTNNFCSSDVNNERANARARRLVRTERQSRQGVPCCRLDTGRRYFPALTIVPLVPRLCRCGLEAIFVDAATASRLWKGERSTQLD